MSTEYIVTGSLLNLFRWVVLFTITAPLPHSIFRRKNGSLGGFRVSVVLEFKGQPLSKGQE